MKFTYQANALLDKLCLMVTILITASSMQNIKKNESNYGEAILNEDTAHDFIPSYKDLGNLDTLFVLF